MRLAALLAVVAVLLCGDSTQGNAAPERRTGAEVFHGLGTWIDIYDTKLYASPNVVAGRLAARGVRTAWIETANDRSATDVVQPAGLGRLVDALHARGITAVAWYLPGSRPPRARPASRAGDADVQDAAGRRLRRRRARHRVAPEQERQATDRAGARSPDPASRGRGRRRPWRRSRTHHGPSSGT